MICPGAVPLRWQGAASDGAAAITCGQCGLYAELCHGQSPDEGVVRRKRYRKFQQLHPPCKGSRPHNLAGAGLSFWAGAIIADRRSRKWRSVTLTEPTQVTAGAVTLRMRRAVRATPPGTCALSRSKLKVAEMVLDVARMRSRDPASKKPRAQNN